ncbi:MULTISPECIES: SsrA-binding protein SmpB [Persicobacter]|uniref:SsrA-binding protein n=1 Tax=Persicobacter diffluens TaxID=981 RepID=A0AAN5ALK7_9BACT|nr:SsrA-binding protein SmpB [Persicobacter sp. CCB-QB2]GJM61541.1 SsrA-binding protein [Persicobacter diffluens]
MAKQKNKKERFSNNINIRNKKASFEYEFIEKLTAGIVLKGSEIKSIREGKVTLGDAFCVFHREELWVRHMHIAPYSHGNIENHQDTRERKLLLNKSELRKLEQKMEEKGLTIVPIRLFLTGKGLAKVEIALARGKKLFDKRATIKDKDVKRDLQRMKY